MKEEKQRLIDLLVDFRKQRPGEAAQPQDPEIDKLAQWFCAELEVHAAQANALEKRMHELEQDVVNRFKGTESQLRNLIELFTKPGGRFRKVFRRVINPTRRLEDKWKPGGAYVQPLNRNQKGP